MTTYEGTTRLRRHGAVIIDNATVYDGSISYSALGVLAVLLARPDEAPKGYRTLLRKEARVGEAAILSAFRELRAAGYRYQFLRTTKTRGGAAKVVTDTYISGTPISLEEAKRWHFEATGQVAIDMPDRRKSKATLASVTGAQSPGAQSPGAQSPAAQDKGLSGLPKTGKQLLPKGADAENDAQADQDGPQDAPAEDQAPAGADSPAAAQVGPPRPAARRRDGATPKPERGPGYEAYQAYKAATRQKHEDRLAAHGGHIKEVAPLRPMKGAGAI